MLNSSDVKQLRLNSSVLIQKTILHQNVEMRDKVITKRSLKGSDKNGETSVPESETSGTKTIKHAGRLRHEKKNHRMRNMNFSRKLFNVRSNGFVVLFRLIKYQM